MSFAKNYQKTYKKHILFVIGVTQNIFSEICVIINLSINDSKKKNQKQQLTLIIK